MLPFVVIELKQRAPRVRFKHPVRVVPLDGSPRIYRTLSANLSRRGMFVRMPEPLPKGTRVALSLEAGGQALPFAEAEIAWCRTNESQLPGRFTGFGVRFTSFLNPRAPELLEYLVKNLDRGRPLKMAPPRSAARWRMVGIAAAVLAVVAVGGLGARAALQRAADDDEVADAVVAPGAITPVDSPKLVHGDVGAPASGETARERRDALTADAEHGRVVRADSPAGVDDAREAVVQDVSAARVEEPTTLAVAPAPGPEAEERADGTSDAVVPAGAEVAGQPVVAAPGATSTGGAKSPAASAGVEAAGKPVVGAPALAAGTDDATVRAGAEAADTAVNRAASTGAAKSPAASAGVGVAPKPAVASAHVPAAPERVGAPSSAQLHASVVPAAPSSPRADVAPTPAGRHAASGVTPSARADPRDVTDVAAKSHAPPAKSAARGRLSLPSGAAQSLAWEDRGEAVHVGLSLAPGATVGRRFLLAGPPRLVLDLDGGAPKKSLTLEAKARWMKQVRIGPHGASTRVVVDLTRAPDGMTQGDDGVTLTFAH